MNKLNVNLSDVSLIIATYNEEESIGYVLSELENLNIGEVIVVDKNSEDNTEQIAKEYGVAVSQQSEGWGGAVKDAIDILKMKYITYMDGDGSYNPNAS